jgi:hypothetical protein
MNSHKIQSGDGNLSLIIINTIKIINHEKESFFPWYRFIERTTRRL